MKKKRLSGVSPLSKNIVAPRLMGMALCLLAATTDANAQADRGGNGGKGFVGQFEFHIEQIQGWIQRGNLNKVELQHLRPTIDVDRFAGDLLYTANRILSHEIRVEFTDQEQKIGNEVRTCRNLRSNGLIRCNNEQWRSKETEQTRYFVTMHELISIAGYEENDGVASEYRISRRLLPFIAPATTYILLDDPQKKVLPGIQCELENKPMFFEKSRRLILQAHERGARIILKESRGISGYQEAFPMKPHLADGSFLKVGRNFRWGDFIIESKDGEVMTLHADVRVGNPDSAMHGSIGNSMERDGYNWNRVHCMPMDYANEEFDFASAGMEYMIWNSMEENRQRLFKGSLRWMHSEGDPNPYLSFPKR
jgi:hypothetical protein